MKHRSWPHSFQKLNSPHLHIVSLDVPFPADYGGAIDIYYRIQALHSLGVKIHLHCFEYGRGQQKELEKYTESVTYYTRKRRLIDLLGKRPFIVKSRISTQLLENLKKDDYPILFEGLHTTWYLEDKEIQQRTTFVRAHNIEHEYYFGLMQNSSRIKKLYFQLEHKKLENYEDVLHHSSAIFPIRIGDLDHFRQYNKHCIVLPASLPHFTFIEEGPTEDYCLFHGNLSVPENHLAANFLLDKVWNDLAMPRLIIAGKDPSDALVTKAKSRNVELIANPCDEQMQSLLQKAKLHILYTTQATGLKLKLLAALQTNGHVVVNSEMTDGTDLERWCAIANSAKKIASTIKDRFAQEIDEQFLVDRKGFVNEKYNTLENCKVIVEMIKNRG